MLAGLRWVALAASCVLLGCQQPAGPPTPLTSARPDPVPVAGVGYVVFNAPITTNSRDLLIADFDKLRSAGATEIDIGINSGGGDIDAAQGIVDHMGQLHAQDGVRFKAYNVGLVASAATFVFLNAQDRYTVPRGAFLFHAAGYVSNGVTTAERLREEAAKLDAYETVMRRTLRARTKLTDAETLTYVRRTVLLSSDDAQRDGVVDAIAPFAPPKDARAWVIAVKPPTPASPNRPATGGGAGPAAAPPPALGAPAG